MSTLSLNRILFFFHHSFTQGCARDGTGEFRDFLARSGSICLTTMSEQSREISSRSRSYGRQKTSGQTGTRIPRDIPASPGIYKFNNIKQKTEEHCRGTAAYPWSHTLVVLRVLKWGFFDGFLNRSDVDFMMTSLNPLIVLA